MGMLATIEGFLAQHPDYGDLARGYIPEREAIESIRANINGLAITVFVGDWCPDCRVQLPAFLAVMSAVDKDKIKIEFIGMDRNKEDALGKAEEMNVLAVPTFIFFRNGNEIGRIIEKPKESLERDIAGILE